MVFHHLSLIHDKGFPSPFLQMQVMVLLFVQLLQALKSKVLFFIWNFMQIKQFFFMIFYRWVLQL